MNRRHCLNLLTLSAAFLLAPRDLLALPEPAQDERISPDPEQTSDEQPVEWISMSVSSGDNQQFFFRGMVRDFLSVKRLELLLEGQLELFQKLAKPRSENGLIWFEASSRGFLLSSVGMRPEHLALGRRDVVLRCLQRLHEEVEQRLEHAEKFGGSPFRLDDNLIPVRSIQFHTKTPDLR